jgi:hypothetical protein
MRSTSHTARPLAEFLAENTPNCTLERFRPTSRILAQSVVDERLVTTPPSRMHLLPKPVDHVVVEPDGDPGLSLRDRNHSAALTLRKVVLLRHRRLPSYCLRSLRVACLAEISRIRGPRHVYAMTRIRPSASVARVTNRSSSGSSSGIVIAISSWRAVAASAKSTPCFWRFSSALSGSHSTCTRASVCTGVHRVQPAAPNPRFERAGERSGRGTRAAVDAGCSTARR